MNLSVKILKIQRAVSVRFRSTLVNIDNFSEEIVENDCVKPYSEVPGPREYPFIGNSWRFAPFIGKFTIFNPDRSNF